VSLDHYPATAHHSGVLLRVLLMLLVVDVSGIAHVGLDMLDALRGTSTETEECEDDCGDCPPGCVSCHCWHGAPAPREVLSSLGDDSAAGLWLTPVEVSVAPRAARAPVGADPDSVYRPPRRCLHV
jgi:hypothetical protein